MAGEFSRGSLCALRPSGTVAFLFTDIEGSSARWEADPTGMRSALLSHDGMLAASVRSHGGVVFASMGDGVGAAFCRAGDALAAAIEFQRHFVASTPALDEARRVRMGIHTSEAEEPDGSYYGPSVNRAARLMAAACGGQIVVSEVTARLLPVGMPVQLRDLGVHRFAGISEPIRVFGISAEGVAWLDQPLRSATVSGNLPGSAGRFIGRSDELMRLGRDMSTRPVITLTGSAAVGKTRLALEVARSLVSSYSEGVWMVELAPVNEPDAVVHTVAGTLGLSVQGFRLRPPAVGRPPGERQRRPGISPMTARVGAPRSWPCHSGNDAGGPRHAWWRSIWTIWQPGRSASRAG
jgi:class 3 adenylate cyclase